MIKMTKKKLKSREKTKVNQGFSKKDKVVQGSTGGSKYQTFKNCDYHAQGFSLWVFFTFLSDFQVMASKLDHCVECHLSKTWGQNFQTSMAVNNGSKP